MYETRQGRYFFGTIEETTTESGENALELKLAERQYSFKMRGTKLDTIKAWLAKGTAAALYYINPDKWRLHILKERSGLHILEWWRKKQRARADACMNQNGHKYTQKDPPKALPGYRTVNIFTFNL